MAADAVVQVGHQILGLIAVKPPQLHRFLRASEPDRSRRDERARQVHHMAAHDRVMATDARACDRSDITTSHSPAHQDLVADVIGE